MKIGYAQVSTVDQKELAQTDALSSVGCERIYIDRVSGKSRERPELTKMLEALR